MVKNCILNRKEIFILREIKNRIYYEDFSSRRTISSERKWYFFLKLAFYPENYPVLKERLTNIKITKESELFFAFFIRVMLKTELSKRVKFQLVKYI